MCAQVDLIAQQDDGYFTAVGEEHLAINVLFPLFGRFETFGVKHIKHDKRAHCVAIIYSCKSLESILAGQVPGRR